MPRGENCGGWNRSHMKSGTPEYKIWSGMKRRCLNPKDKDYRSYGGNGIEVCEEWRRDFVAFVRDMGARPSRLHSIERRNNKLGYEPANCYWATPKEQTGNRDIAINIEYLDQTKPLTEWCNLFGINYFTVYGRIYRRNWSIERALTTPARGYAR